MPKFIVQVKRESRVDPNTGNTSYVYTYKMKRCPTKEIKSPLAKKYVGYDLIYNDLECVHKWINQAHKLIPQNRKSQNSDHGDRYIVVSNSNDDSLIQALFIASLTYYGKCFTKAEGRRFKLDCSFVPEGYKLKHKEIMLFRHTIAAHSGKGDWDTGKLRLILSPKKSKKHEPFIWSELTTLNYHDDSDKDFSFINLVDEVRSKVLAKMEQLSKRILDDIRL